MVKIRIKEQSYFELKFPWVTLDDIYYDEAKDILHIGAWKRSLGIKDEPYEIVLGRHDIEVYCKAKGDQEQYRVYYFSYVL